jgi:hypothetical protein
MKLKCAGAVSGTVEVGDTVGQLLRALEALVGGGTAPGSLKVIAGGKKLSADEDALLSTLGTPFAPYTLHPATPCTLHPTPYILNPSP